MSSDGSHWGLREAWKQRVRHQLPRWARLMGVEIRVMPGFLSQVPTTPALNSLGC